MPHPPRRTAKKPTISYRTSDADYALIEAAAALSAELLAPAMKNQGLAASVVQLSPDQWSREITIETARTLLEKHGRLPKPKA